MPKSINYEKIEKVVFYDEDETDILTDDVLGGKLDCCSTPHGESEVSIVVQPCGRFSVPITKDAFELLLSVAEDLPFMKMMMPNETPSSVTYIYGERVQFISYDFPQEPVMPKIVSHLCKSVFGTEDGKVVNDILKLQLDKVILMKETTNNHSISLNESEAYPGICFTVLLLVPTEEGFTGGTLKVLTRQQGFQRFFFEKDSNKDFAILMFPAETRYEIERIDAGTAFIAVFHLIWTDSFVSSSPRPHLSKTIKLYQNLKNLLSPWELQQLDGGERVARQEDLTANAEVLLDPANGDCADLENIGNALKCETEGNEEDTQHNSTSDSLGISKTKDGMETKYLVFLLAERYSASNIVNISQLIGHDQLLLHVLQSLEFIDVHLAIVFVSNASGTRSLSCAGVYQWIGLAESFPQGTTYGPLSSSQLLGMAGNYLFNSTGADGEELFAHYALIVQPRKQSVDSSCHHNMERVLDCLEHRLWPLLRLSRSKRSSKRNLLKSDLSKVIEYCSKEPASAFHNCSPKTEKRSARLLTLCLNLRAREEAMAMLLLLGTDFSVEQQDPNSNSLKTLLFYEGLRTDESSRIVADLEYRVVEWKESGDLILRLVSPLRIFRQLNCFINLVHHFLDRNRFQAGRQVANRIFEILSKLSSDQANYIRPDQHKQCASFIFSLELRSQTSDEERLDNYFVLFRKVQFAIQSQVLIHIKDSQRTPLTSKLFEEMIEAALFNSFSSESLVSCAPPIMEIVLRSNNEALQHRLVSRIEDEKDVALKRALVDGIVKSLHPIDLVTYTDRGLMATSYLMNIAIDNLKSKATKLYGDGNQPPEHWDTDFRTDLHSILRLVMLMENQERAVNPTRVYQVGNVLFNLPLICLCHLLHDLRISDGEELRKHPRSYNLYFEICQLIGLKRREFVAKLPPGAIVELMESFIWFGDIHVASNLIHQLNFEEPYNKWSEVDVISLLSTMTSASELWKLIVPASSEFVFRTVNVLLRAWMTSLSFRLKELSKEDSYFLQLRCQVFQEAKICLTLYVRNSLKFSEEACTDFSPISSLMKLFNPLEVSEVIVHSRKTNKMFWKVYKKKGVASYHVYLFICSHLATCDIGNLVESCDEKLLNALICIFWVGDEELLTTLVNKIMSALPENRENSFVAGMLASPVIRQLAKKSATNREAFFLLVEHRIKWLRGLITREPMEDQMERYDESNEYQGAVQEIEDLSAYVEQLQGPCGDPPKEEIKTETNQSAPTIST